ncbi:MAG: hypothetical protein M1819_007245 [Sarea resinae]|nr:MAG: hypothetical protein M1819_007245 [Sarea resinae]
MATPKLTHTFTIKVVVPPGMDASPNPHTNLTVVNVNKGTVTSADGSITLQCAGGADYMLAKPDSATQSIDARLSFVGDSSNGLNLDFQYLGKITISPEMMEVFKSTPGKETEFGQPYFYTTPRVSSKSEKLAWVNDTVFLAMGKVSVLENRDIELCYRIFKVG